VSRRLLATYIALALAVLASLEIPLGITYGRSERRDLISRIERDALTMATVAEENLEAGRLRASPGVSRVARSYQRSIGGRVVIVDSRGLAVLDTHAPAPGRRDFVTRPEIRAALQGNISSGTRYSKTLGANLIYVAVPVASGGVVRGAVRITYPTSTLDRRVRRYWLLLAAIAGVVLAATFLVGIRLARSTTEPLEQLEGAARAAAGGDLTARAPEDVGPPEIRALAAQFNEMVSRLDALIHSQQEFVADASHQLRTPLTALRLRLENLERDVEPAGREELVRALGEVERLGLLVDGLLALARADAAQAKPQAVDLHEIVLGRVEAWAGSAAAAGVTVEPRLQPGLEALATPGALEQVLDNLIANALGVSSTGATIVIEGRFSDGWAELNVLDEGPGMSPEHRARAFDRFWREGSDAEGTGLGLAIANRLVAADGGRLELREAPGGGLDAAVLLRRR
jgi:signal transduction histidine kinase